MNIEEIRAYCLKKPAASEDMPFDDETLVFKVCGKMFALLSLDGNLSLNLKCEPLRALELREQYQTIIPGYHMNKKYWNTLILDGSLTWDFVSELIDHSYEQVMEKLPKKIKNTIIENGVK